jgi:hypothetical protein
VVVVASTTAPFCKPLMFSIISQRREDENCRGLEPGQEAERKPEGLRRRMTATEK